ncbi:LacI family DNA-binding transcriptional regulator [Leifsonia sp. 21MFCrub1.1]|uniref:LacI family DNA-binding transcriptional regulator n=1 Tax=Leifsonia sp. 21MFCrub1.1 TaxID=1798223 RepID=UPI0008927D76|nr:LacI family DNA-binding transcriptional regulator [Leifsonia sp. 21MFCrub1.1]SEB07321.1 DNA-binding transcriptional regulator, LacI/PurR family [Leifsonia sp. 21MFCrub1.1]
MGTGSGPDPASGAAREPGERRITIADVAARAGVSKSAVSFVFNGRRGLSEGTTDRIVRAARDLGWRPSSRARALSGQRPRTAGLVLRRDAAAASSDLVGFLHGIGSALAATGAVLVVRVVATDADEREAYSAFAREAQVDVVLLAGLRVADDRPAALARLGLPFVSADSVGAPDQGERMRQAIRHLAGIGHRRIALVADGSLARSARWSTEFARESRLLGLDARVAWVSPSIPITVRDATAGLLDRAEPPTGIVYESDLLAAAGMQAALRRGLEVPDELSVIALDDGPVALVTNPALSVVRRDAEAWGRACGRLLANSGGGSPGDAFPPAELIVRGSTAPPSPSNQERSR